MRRGCAGGWRVLFLAAVITSPRLGTDGHFVSRPILRPSEVNPRIGTYTLKTPAGDPCIKATMGAQFIVTEKKKSWFFNLDPSAVGSRGRCGEDTAVLSLALPDGAAGLQFTFRKENNLFFVAQLTAHVSPLPVCQGCANKTYSGLVAHLKLFPAAFGQSFKCTSGNLLTTSPELKIRLVPLQLQAFRLPGGQYGQAVECSADVRQRVVPVVLGAVAVGLVLIAMLSFLFIKDQRRPGYERL